MKKSMKYFIGLGIFLTISAISIVGVILYYKGKLDFSHLTTTSLLIATGISVSSLYFETERVRLLAYTMNVKVPFRGALENVMGREFLSAITPFGSGGQPLGVFILNKYNLNLGQAITISYLETFYTILILFFAGLVCLIFNLGLLKSGVLVGFLVWSFGSMVYFMSVTYFSISKPKILKKFGFFVVNLLNKIKLLKTHKMHSTKMRVIQEIKTFNQHIKASLKSHWFVIFNMFLFTLIFWVLRFAAVWPLVLVLGYKISFIDLIAYQMIITSVNYFSFTPGSSGTTDWLGMLLFGTFIAAKEMGNFVFLWRFFSYHLIIMICGIIVFKVIYLFSKQSKKTKTNPRIE